MYMYQNCMYMYMYCTCNINYMYLFIAFIVLFRVMMSPIQSLAHFSVIVELKKTGVVKYDNNTIPNM